MPMPLLDVRETFAMRLSQAMDEANISGKELAAMLSHSEATISNWRTGKYLPDVNTLAGIATYLGKQVDWLLGTDGAAEATRHEHQGIIWQVQIPDHVQGQARREIRLGVSLFEALVPQNLDLSAVRRLKDFRHYDIETLYGFLKIAFYGNALRIVHVPRHHELEQQLRQRYHFLRDDAVIVADIQDKNDGTLIRPEFVGVVGCRYCHFDTDKSGE